MTYNGSLRTSSINKTDHREIAVSIVESGVQQHNFTNKTDGHDITEILLKVV
jgi:hypothetical protein